jgi:hypothetical protein
MSLALGLGEIWTRWWGFEPLTVTLSRFDPAATADYLWEKLLELRVESCES